MLKIGVRVRVNYFAQAIERRPYHGFYGSLDFREYQVR